MRSVPAPGRRAFFFGLLLWAPIGASASGPPNAEERRVAEEIGRAAAEDPETPPQVAPASPALGKITPSGYVEAFYSYNFNRPSNRITNFRGFDDRESSFTLSNALLGAAWEKGPVSGKISAQVGHTPNTYYLAEPSAAGTSATGASDAGTWKYLQEAWAGYKAPPGSGLLFQAGLFLSPIGVEGMAVKDNWNWSRSNLFFGLPFYHAGIRATYALTPQWTAELMISNGWNSIVDNNRQKSIEAAATWKASRAWSLHFLYFGGVERPAGAAEGSPWRHLFDAYGTWDATKRLSFILHADGGWEDNRFGRSSWYAGAGYVRVQLASRLSLAVRADFFREVTASDAAGRASSIFWPARRVASQTATLEFHPQDNLSIRLESRHDGASTEMYFRRQVASDGTAPHPYVPNARSQTTATLGMTAWF